MIATPEEAKRWWCPNARVTAVHRENRIEGVGNGNRIAFTEGQPSDIITAAHCLANRCAAWRWYNGTEIKGYCGAFGKPQYSSPGVG